MKTPTLTSTTVTSIQSLRERLKPLRHQQKIALVPTMGNLHAGHLSLVKLAQQHADIVVVSIFVNPTQFGVGEDLDSYPRTLDADSKMLADIGVDYIFTPSVSDMYPVMPPPTKVLAGALGQQLCGNSRSTHFDGVGIVVTKLFNIVNPDVAVFGQKDYQQLAIIRQLVRDLSYDITILAAPIVRSDDGLALSSRNQYLTHAERQIAPLLHQELDRLARRLKEWQADSVDKRQLLINESIDRINKTKFTVDYLEVLNQDLTPIIDMSLPRNWVVLAAAHLGAARLLDNQQISV